MGDIFNVQSGTTGNQVIGRITMKLPSRDGDLGTLDYAPSGRFLGYETGVLIADISGFYEERFNDPQYY